MPKVINPIHPADTKALVDHIARKAIRKRFIDLKASYTAPNIIAEYLGVTVRYFQHWAILKKIRRHGRIYNLRDIGDVLLAGVDQINERADIHGNWETWGTMFFLGHYEIFMDRPAAPIYIIARPQYDGNLAWAVCAYTDPCWVLTKELEWVFESEQKKRKVIYLRMTRFETKEDALDYYCRFVESMKMDLNGQYDLNKENHETDTL